MHMAGKLNHMLLGRFPNRYDSAGLHEEDADIGPTLASRIATLLELVLRKSAPNMTCSGDLAAVHWTSSCPLNSAALIGSAFIRS